MIIGIGVDLCSHSRMKKLLENQHFLQRVFHDHELKYAFAGSSPERALASSFAAREAFKKASGIPFFKVICKGVWVARTDRGPVLKYNDQILYSLKTDKSIRSHLSLSHENDLALAMVILEV
ncbi:MAG: holo-ACP synthase [Synergistales bacterium]|nr:holo-ACP synthase [Synergistales bacterium]